VLVAMMFAASGASVAEAAVKVAAAPADSSASPLVTVEGGIVRGTFARGGYAFRGLPYAAAPIGNLRWRPPRAPASWDGVRDATRYGASCPQAPSPFVPSGRQSEDCLFLNSPRRRCAQTATGRCWSGSTAAD
jgi:para-nitrobenzyl esterase